MKTMTGLRAALAALLLLTGAGAPSAVFAASLTARRLSCGSNAASPTTIVSASAQSVREIHLINANTDYVLIGDSSTAFSTSASSGTARLVTPSGTAPRELMIENFSGKLTCVGSGNGTPGSGGTGTVIDYWMVK